MQIPPLPLTRPRLLCFSGTALPKYKEPSGWGGREARVSSSEDMARVAAAARVSSLSTLPIPTPFLFPHPPTPPGPLLLTCSDQPPSASQPLHTYLQLSAPHPKRAASSFTSSITNCFLGSLFCSLFKIHWAFPAPFMLLFLNLFSLFYKLSTFCASFSLCEKKET